MKDQGKVVLISGGSRGLGSGIVTALLDAGHAVATFSRTKSDFIITKENSYSDRFLWIKLSSDNSNGMRDFVRKVLERFGKIDVLINNAAIAGDGVLPLMDEAKIQEIVNINLTSLILLSKHCSRAMLSQKGGVIINISSIVALSGYAGLATYSATKAGIIGFTKSLARELGPKSIRVNTIAPGYLETDMSNTLSSSQLKQIIRRTPLGRIGKIEDLIGLIDLLISDRAAFITGQTFVVDGGITC